MLVRRRGRPLDRVAAHPRVPAADLAADPPLPLARGRAPHRRRGRAHARPRRRAARGSASRARSGRSRTSAIPSRSSRSTATVAAPRPARRARARRRRRAGRVRRPPHRAEAARPRARRARGDARARRAGAPRRGRRRAAARRSFEQRRRRARARAVRARARAPRRHRRRSSPRSTCSSSRATPKGLPGVLIEAQMAGCPIVTVPVGGVRDLVDDGETGVVHRATIDARRARRPGRRPPPRPAAARPARRARPPAGGPVLVEPRPRAPTPRGSTEIVDRDLTRSRPRSIAARRCRARSTVLGDRLPLLGVSCDYVRILPRGRPGLRAQRVLLVDARRRPRQDLWAGRTDLARGLAERWGGGVAGVGRFSTAPLSEGPSATSDPHRLARSVYGVAQGRGTTSLRVLDFGVIGAAWLLGYLAGFAGDAPFGVARLHPVPAHPDRRAAVRQPGDGALRTGVAVRVGRGSGARRRGGRRSASSPRRSRSRGSPTCST